MNDLAHLYLARPDPLSRVGNLLGDHRRGVEPHALSPPVRRGLANHQAVDAFTDAHPLVREGRRLFSPARRRFAGVALDVVFDHFLIRHWDAFADQPLEPWIERVYQDLLLGGPAMPAAMRAEIQRRMSADWLRRYRDLDTVGSVLDRIAAGLRFHNDFAGIIDEIRDREGELEAVFLGFFPGLSDHVREQALESPASGPIGP